jgi:hypothetical protein
VQFIHFALDKLAKQIHQALDFIRRARPILGGKRVDGQDLDAQILRSTQNTPDILGASAVSG